MRAAKLTDGRMDERTDGLNDWLPDRLTDWRTDGRTDGLMDGLTDGWTEKQKPNKVKCYNTSNVLWILFLLSQFCSFSLNVQQRGHMRSKTQALRSQKKDSKVKEQV